MKPTSKATYPLKLPTSIKAAARLAKEHGGGLHQWIATAVAQKIGVVETAAEFFKRRSNSYTLDDLDRVLDKVPNRRPGPGDELPEGWTPDRLRHNEWIESDAWCPHLTAAMMRLRSAVQMNGSGSVFCSATSPTTSLSFSTKSGSFKSVNCRTWWG